METLSLVIGGTTVQTVISGDPVKGNALPGWQGVGGRRYHRLLRGGGGTNSKDSGI